MHIELAYGRHGLAIDVPDDTTVLVPTEVPPLGGGDLNAEAQALRDALRAPIGSAPLRDRVQPDDDVVIVFSDITRPMPNDRVLPVLLAELSHVPRERILLLNALGTHRPNTPQELDEMLGREIARGYRIAQHDCWDDANLVDLGMTSYGHPILINRQYCEASVKILTGFIEPHFFAGFSGGPKAVLPGVAGFPSIMDNHGYTMITHPNTTWGRTAGNPLWEEIREVAALTRPDFLLNVTLNRQRRVTGIYAGDVWAAHALGVEAARAAAMVPVAETFDIVVTTNSGYPLDINLYQAVKGMACAAQIVRPGGTIVVAAECRDGVPEHGEYRRIVHEAGSVERILETIGQPGYRRHDQWEALMQARIQQKAEVHVYSDGLTDDEIRGMLLTPCNDIPATLAGLHERYGPQARLCVLPDGPQTIPYLAADVPRQAAQCVGRRTHG